MPIFVSVMASVAENQEYTARAELLLGADVLARLGEISVLLFGCGGVGSWAAEGLVRSGVRHMTLVDADVISAMEDSLGRLLFLQKIFENTVMTT